MNYFIQHFVTITCLLVSTALSVDVGIISRGKLVTMSASYGSGSNPSNANDGNYVTDDVSQCATVTKNASYSYSWWTLDLGKPCIITSIVVYGASVVPDGLIFKGFSVYGYAPSLKQYTEYIGWHSLRELGVPVRANFPAFVARYITLRDYDEMTLCEVDVIGSDQFSTIPEDNVSLMKPATQGPDTFNSRLASYAVDGNNQTSNPDACATSFNGTFTGGNYRVWWQVDLQGLYLINAVDIYFPTVAPDKYFTRYLNIYVTFDSARRSYSYNTGFTASGATRIHVGILKLGRYITIMQPSNSYPSILTLCEVAVLGVKQNVTLPDDNDYLTTDTYPATMSVNDTTTAIAASTSTPSSASNEDRDSYRILAITAIVVASVFAVFSIIILVVICLLFKRVSGQTGVAKRDETTPNKYNNNAFVEAALPQQTGYQRSLPAAPGGDDEEGYMTVDIEPKTTRHYQNIRR